MQHPVFSLLFAGTLGALLLSCSRQPDNKAAEQKEVAPPQEVAVPSDVPAKKIVAVLKTTEGEMVVEFWPEVAPRTVENFLKLSMSGFYDGTAFHRIIDGFMIQGGDPYTKDPSKEAMYGTGSADGRIKAEFSDRKHEFGVLSMARSANPDSASSQFFICLGPAPQLDGQYTAFGKLIKGEDVLKKIGATPCGPGSDRNNSKPLTRVGLESVKVAAADSVK